MMIATHEHVHRAMSAAMPAEIADGARRCAQDLHALLAAGDGPVERRTVMAAYGGGKDSTFLVAFIRLVQLEHERMHGRTFRLRVVTNRQPGMGPSVMANIAGAYAAMGMTDDADCELLLIDGDEVRPFRADAPLPESVVARFRTDVLMAGHRTSGDGRATFCNACNLGMLSAFSRGAGLLAPAHVVVTGDSTRERRLYQIWLGQLADRLGIDRSGAGDFASLLGVAGRISATYFRDIHGADDTAAVHERAFPYGPTGRPHYFSVFEYVDYACSTHWDLLTGFLAFEFTDESFNFTESDCGNPMLMAHLRGLKTQYRYGRDYADGIAEYLDFALPLMRVKELPEQLVSVMRERYERSPGVAGMRERATEYASGAYGLTEENLICLVFAPFVARGARLGAYLRARRPDLVADEPRIRAVLSGERHDERLAGELRRLSGLSLPGLLHLYDSQEGFTPSGSRPDLLGLIRDRDPHTGEIATRRSPDGPVEVEVISGR
jgi:hypothetical protein